MDISSADTLPTGPALIRLVTAVLERAPAWLRQDLASADLAARTRAEETLAGMIAAALAPVREQARVGDAEPIA